MVHGNLTVLNILLSLAGEVRIGEPVNIRVVPQFPQSSSVPRRLPSVDEKSGLERADTKALSPMFQLCYDEDDSALTLAHPEHSTYQAKDFLHRTATASTKDLSHP